MWPMYGQSLVFFFIGRRGSHYRKPEFACIFNMCASQLLGQMAVSLGDGVNDFIVLSTQYFEASRLSECEMSEGSDQVEHFKFKSNQNFVFRNLNQRFMLLGATRVLRQDIRCCCHLLIDPSQVGDFTGSCGVCLQIVGHAWSFG